MRHVALWEHSCQGNVMYVFLFHVLCDDNEQRDSANQLLRSGRFSKTRLDNTTFAYSDYTDTMSPSELSSKVEIQSITIDILISIF